MNSHIILIRPPFHAATARWEMANQAEFFHLCSFNQWNATTEIADRNNNQGRVH